jgi:hypothetical protein
MGAVERNILHPFFFNDLRAHRRGAAPPSSNRHIPSVKFPTTTGSQRKPLRPRRCQIGVAPANSCRATHVGSHVQGGGRGNEPRPPLVFNTQNSVINHLTILRLKTAVMAVSIYRRDRRCLTAHIRRLRVSVDRNFLDGACAKSRKIEESGDMTNFRTFRLFFIFRVFGSRLGKGVNEKPYRENRKCSSTRPLQLSSFIFLGKVSH